MSNGNARIFVSNLNYETNEQELRQAFEEFGPVAEVKIIVDRDSGKSRGFGFVQMSTDEDARAAISELHESRLGGRPIKVTVANPRPERGNGSRPRGNERNRRPQRGGNRGHNDIDYDS